MLGLTKNKKEQKQNPPGPAAKARAKHRAFVQFVKGFGLDLQQPNARAWAARRILHEAKKYRVA